jgi:hypothetical protein
VIFADYNSLEPFPSVRRYPLEASEGKKTKREGANTDKICEIMGTRRR